MPQESMAVRLMTAADPNLPKELKKDDPELFRSYAEHSDDLEDDLYTQLSEMSFHCGLGPGAKGMAIIALTAATDLFKQVGIEGPQFEALVKASMNTIEKLYKELEIGNGTAT